MATVVNRTYHSRHGGLLEITFTVRGVFRNLSRGELIFFHPRGGSAPFLGHENPLKSIDFTGPGGGLSPNSPPPEYASVYSTFNCFTSIPKRSFL